MSKSPSNRTDRDHGGGLDAAVQRFGGLRADWIDLSTGLNPVVYPVPDVPAEVWTALPDEAAQTALIAAARAFWCVPEAAAVLPVPGASAAIARIPALCAPGCVRIDGPTYNEHAAAFRQEGWTLGGAAAEAQARVLVHPNNPDGRCFTQSDLGTPLTIIDESFCDLMPEASLIAAAGPGRLVLKSFGKFWGLAGLRLGFVIGDQALVARLAEMLGPWPVSGPALYIGARALADLDWASAARARLVEDAARLDALMAAAGARDPRGTALFRLYEVDDAVRWHARLAEARIWTRIFPWSRTALRLGLPAPAHWGRLAAALA